MNSVRAGERVVFMSKLGRVEGIAVSDDSLGLVLVALEDDQLTQDDAKPVVAVRANQIVTVDGARR